MLITENDLRQIIRKVLLENKKLPKDGGKMFDGVTYSSKDAQGNKSMTLVFYDGNNAYFLLGKDTTNKDSKLKTVTDKVTAQYMRWTSDLDKYTDYSQDNFAKHLEQKRIVYSPVGLDNVKEEELDTGFDMMAAVDLTYDTIVDGGAAIAGLFPPTVAASSAANIAQAVKKLAQGKVLDATISAVSAIPITASGVAVLGNLARNPSTRKGIAEFIKESPGIVKGIKDFQNALKNNKPALIAKFKEITKKANKPDSLATSMLDSITKLVEKLLEDI